MEICGGRTILLFTRYRPALNMRRDCTTNFVGWSKDLGPTEWAGSLSFLLLKFSDFATHFFMPHTLSAVKNISIPLRAARSTSRIAEKRRGNGHACMKPRSLLFFFKRRRRDIRKSAGPTDAMWRMHVAVSKCRNVNLLLRPLRIRHCSLLILIS